MRSPAVAAPRKFALLASLVHALCMAAGVPGAAAGPVPADTQEIAPLQPDTAQPEVPRVDESLQKALARLRSDATSSPNASDPAARSPARIARAREASWLLGLLALHGIGMPVDTGQAQAWFVRAQRLGHPLAAAGLAWCAIEGCLGPPQPAAARPWIDALAKTDPGRAFYLQWLVEKAQRGGKDAAPGPELPASAVPPVPAPERNLLLRAARAGSVHAQSELAIEDATAGRVQEAARRFRELAPRSPAAASNAAVLQERLRPATTPRDKSQATELFERARRYHRGEGVPANYTEAIRLYEQAANQGSAEARRMLELIFSRPAPGGSIDIAWMQQLANVDVSRSGRVTVNPPTAGGGLRRDPTPLYDLVPKEWRDRSGGSR